MSKPRYSSHAIIKRVTETRRPEMSDDKNKTTVRFQIDIEVYGNAADFYKEMKAEEVLHWVISRRTKYVGCGMYAPDLPEGVVPPMVIMTPKRIQEGE